MTPIELLTQRCSSKPKHLTLPAPTADEIAQMLTAANHAPDHGCLTPWRFIMIEREQQPALGEVFVEALRRREPETPEPLLARQRDKATKAPLLVVAAVHLHQDSPIPEIEQYLAAGAATEHFQLAANALGYGSIWLSGNKAFDPYIHQQLGLAHNEKIIGFLSIGTPKEAAKPRPRTDIAQIHRYWSA